MTDDSPLHVSKHASNAIGTGRFLGISQGKARGRPRAIQDTFMVNIKVLLTLDTVIGNT